MSIRRLLIILLTLSLLLGCRNEKPAQQESKKADAELFETLKSYSKVAGSKAMSELNSSLVLVNFWATWCAPCVAEMPSLQRLYDTFTRSELEIVTVAVDVDKAAIESFLNERKLTFVALHDPLMDSPPKFGVTGFPETFFFNRKGELLEIRDPESGLQVRKIVSDREWDSATYVSLIREIIRENQGA